MTLATTLASPAPAYTQTSHCPSPNSNSNMIDDFFGMPTTRESRHDSLSSMEILPSYTESLPAYSSRAEPATLAMYLFKFGFLFPPFWILGVLILMSPLRAPEPSSTTPAWLPEKPEEEWQIIIAEMRRVEVKWAKRCLYALLTLVAIGTAVGLAIWSALRR